MYLYIYYITICITTLYILHDIYLTLYIFASSPDATYKIMFIFELFCFGDLSHSLTIPSMVNDFKISNFSFEFSPESPIS